MKNDNLQKWALISEIVGALAVVVTLIFLILQINESVKATRSQVAQGIFDQLLEANLAIGATPGVAEAWSTWNETESYESLTPAQARAVSAALTRFMTVYDNAYYQYRTDALDEEIFSRFSDAVEDRVTRAYFDEYWERSGQPFTPGFQSWVNELRQVQQ